METEDINSLIIKKITGEINRDDELKLEEWIMSHPSNQQQFDDFERIWNQAEREPLTIDTDKAWQKINKQLLTVNEPKQITLPFYKQSWFNIAASLLLFAGLGTLLYIFVLNQPEFHKVTASAGEIKQLELPDGSKIWLKEYSTLSYEGELNGAQRKVTLNGMAYFEVAKDAAHPFIVKTPNGEVKVLGTAFEIFAYGTDSVERVTVTEGKVSFTAFNQTEVVLTPNQEQVFTPHLQYTKLNVPSASLTSWINTKLDFNNDSLGLVADKLERYFNIKIVFENPGIKSCSFTGKFDNPQLSEVLTVISKVLPITYVIKGNMVFFKGNTCQ